MMSRIPQLSTAKALPDYRIELVYEDGLKGIADLSDLKGKGVFMIWKDDAAFRRFNINKWKKLSWTDDVEIDPDGLYLEIAGKSFQAHAGY